MQLSTRFKPFRVATTGGMVQVQLERSIDKHNSDSGYHSDL